MTAAQQILSALGLSPDGDIYGAAREASRGNALSSPRSLLILSGNLCSGFTVRKEKRSI